MPSSPIAAPGMPIIPMPPMPPSSSRYLVTPLPTYIDMKPSSPASPVHSSKEALPASVEPSAASTTFWAISGVSATTIQSPSTTQPPTSPSAASPPPHASTSADSPSSALPESVVCTTPTGVGSSSPRSTTAIAAREPSHGLTSAS